ncbi:MAG TPA: prolyl oligopeptidase family serine peptidase, partial [Granulicella sp.]
MPPILDRNLFFGEIQISGAQISPDGAWISFLKPYKGTRNIWVKRIEEPFDAARSVSAESTRPVSGYFWTRDSKFLLYAQDKDGDENFNVYAIDPRAEAEPATGVPPTRNLTQAQGVRAMIYSVPRSLPDVLFIGLNDRDPAWHDLYQLTLSSGEKKLLRSNTESIAAWIFDHAGTLRLAVKTTPAGDTEILRVDADGFHTIYQCSVFESCATLRFTADNGQVYLASNKGSQDLTSLQLLAPATGAVTTVEHDPEERVDLDDALFSDIDDRLLATSYEDERSRWYWKDADFEQDYTWLRSQLPDKEVHFGSRSRDEQVWIVSASSDREPGETYVFDRSARTLSLQYRIREELPREALATMTTVRYPSSDGLEIPAYLTLPKGVPAKELPLLVVPHGGPWARNSWGYDTFAQFYANRGYAVLQPNFRGSTGFGKRFLNAGNGEWGRTMQDDLTWGVKYLVEEGIADPKRIGIAGGSYGGYATLAGVAFTPELYAAAVSIVGPSNLITLLNSIPPYWEAARKQMYTRMADPT